MNYLLIDIGNSETKLYFYKKRIERKIFIKSKIISEKVLRNKLSFTSKKKNRVDKVVLSSVSKLKKN